MDRRQCLLLGLAAAAGLVWYVWTFEGGVHNVQTTPDAVDPSYSPYDHWINTRPGGYVRHFPDRIGPACLGEIYANEDQGTLSTSEAAYSGAEEYSA